MPIPLPDGLRRSRMLPALVLVTALYIGLDELGLALFSGGQALRAALPATLGASDAEIAAVAQASAAREARLTPRHRLAAFQLGQALGMGAELTGLALGRPALQAQREAEARRLIAHDGHDRLLGVAPVAPLVPRSMGEFGRLWQLIEQDSTGLAARVEAQTSPRHRHLLLAGMHAGVFAAAVSVVPDTPLPPDAANIARHLALAGVPQRLWVPLTRSPADADLAARPRAYLAALRAVEAALLDPDLADATDLTDDKGAPKPPEGMRPVR